MRILTTLLMLLQGVLLSPLAVGENSREFDPYVIQYVVVPTEQLSEEEALLHHLSRSPKRAVINVKLLKREEGELRSIPARVDGYLTTRNNHLSSLHFFPIRSGSELSYSDHFQIDEGGESLHFQLEVEPLLSGFRFLGGRWGSEPAMRIEFTHSTTP